MLFREDFISKLEHSLISGMVVLVIISDGCSIVSIIMYPLIVGIFFIHLRKTKKLLREFFPEVGVGIILGNIGLMWSKQDLGLLTVIT